jgi:hypothetical protein
MGTLVISTESTDWWFTLRKFEIRDVFSLVGALNLKFEVEIYKELTNGLMRD